jgi:radical SAM superfamily enzyme YgiQ (UPF0313 family)
MKKICLIIPDSPFLLDARVFPFIGILKVAAAFQQQGAIVDVVDLSGVTNWKDVVDKYFETNSDFEFIGLTATTPQMPMTFDIATYIKSKNPKFKLVLGGTHVTLMHTAMKLEIKNSIENGRSKQNIEKIKEVFNVLVCGDGELLLDQIRSMDSGIIDADDRKSEFFLSDKQFSDLPPPARHLIDLETYQYTIEGHKATSLIGQLGCPYRCISGDERVVTSQGLVKIKDLCPPEEKSDLKLEIEVSSEGKVSKTSHALNQGLQPTVKIDLHGMLDFTCHPDHRVRIVRSGKIIWCEAKNVLASDWMPIQLGSYCYPTEYVRIKYEGYLSKSVNSGNFVAKFYRIPSILDEDLAWIMGFLIGDGSISDRGLTFAVDPVLEIKLRDLVKKLFDFDIKVYRIKKTKVVKQAWIYSSEILDFFLTTLNFDKKNKHRVSELIYKSPKSVIEAFLNGLWDADAYKKGDYLVTAYKDLAKEVADLHIYVGSPVSIQQVVIKIEDGKTKTHYRVKKLMSSYVPCDIQIYHDKKGVTRIRKTKQENRMSLRREVLARVDPNNELLRKDLYFVKINSVNKSEPEVLYDLTVPNDENYVSSGIISHNCTFCSGRNSPSLRVIRNRTVDSIVEEVEFLYNTYGYTGYMFYDDELNVSKSMVDLMHRLTDLQMKIGKEFRLRGFIKSELFNEIQAKAMYDAGFRWLLCGFESGDERILKNIEKQANKADNSKVLEIAKKYNLKTKALMSVGHAGESEQTVDNTKRWLLENAPEDFDCTVITTYPGSPYYDSAVQSKDDPSIYIYTQPKTGDVLFQKSLDYTKESDYYKGIPGNYISYVWTDKIDAKTLVDSRDALEKEVREKLNIPFNPTGVAKQYEHSMGQGNILPDWLLRSSKDFCVKKEAVLPPKKKFLEIIR